MIYKKITDILRKKLLTLRIWGEECRIGSAFVSNYDQPSFGNTMDLSLHNLVTKYSADKNDFYRSPICEGAVEVFRTPEQMRMDALEMLMLKNDYFINCSGDRHGVVLYVNFSAGDFTSIQGKDFENVIELVKEQAERASGEDEEVQDISFKTFMRNISEQYKPNFK